MGSDSSQTPIEGCEALSRKLEAEALHKRFEEFPILANPLDFPFAKQLAGDAVPISTVPLMPELSQSAFLAVRVVWRNLELHIRQPDASSLLICNIERAASTETLGSPLLALSSFLRYAVHRSDLIEVIGGCVSKAQNAGEGELAFPRLRDFYTRLVGDLHEYRDIDVVWLFGLTRRPSRYAEQKIWQRR
jgi:hypothetical protein